MPASNEEKKTAEEIIGIMTKPSEADKALIRKAVAFALEVHKDHKRNSGEPYFNHLYATAYALAEIDMDAKTIVAGFLHDSIEDVGVTAETIKEQFGEEVLFLVEGVTKLGELKYRGAERHIESLRRLFVATSKDIRVLLIKLMDRRHNIMTLEYVPEHKRERIASETLSIYAPLADRLGMGEIKRELEDLSFKFVNREEYEKMSEIMRESKLEKEPQLKIIIDTLRENLTKQGVKGFRTESRVKGLYSLYKKRLRKGNDLDNIYDLLAIRIIVGSIEDCYRALGVVHTLWRPLPGKIKDYIAFPKPNGYRSIHTTVVTKEAGPVEIQFRTEQMHQEAQYGIASHLTYKESGERADRSDKKKNNLWYRQLIPSLLKSTPVVSAEVVATPPPKWVNDLASAHEFEEPEETKTYMQEISDDFFSHRIFVFTPKGDVVDLPIDSTPIDFAYAIHSEIGYHTSGAKVNGKLVSLDSTLSNGDIVQIETKKNARPSKKWLKYIRTTMARKHINQTLAKQYKRETELK
jgi:GTP diphosphokinase / guanosine-3',5'-bis(diphosphate) 3'-diphosphatase